MSIMTDIRDRLMASGDTEAAHALDHACFAARDRLDALDEMRKDLAAKEATIAEQAEQIKDLTSAYLSSIKELKAASNREEGLCRAKIAEQAERIAALERQAEVMAQALNESEKTEIRLRLSVANKDSYICELEARLEIDHAYQWQGDSEELVRIDIAPEDRATMTDGIMARDATINLQDEALERKRERISELEAALGEAGEVLEPFVAWKGQMENHPHVLSTKCTFDDDDLPFTVTPEWRHLRRAAALREKIMDLCHASPVPGCETSSPRSEAPQSTDGENTQ